MSGEKQKIQAVSVLGITLSSLFIIAGICTMFNYTMYKGDFYTDISKCMHRGFGFILMCVGVSSCLLFIIQMIKNESSANGEKKKLSTIKNQYMPDAPQNELRLSLEQINELKQYKELVSEGIITEEEFLKKKDQIIG